MIKGEISFYFDHQNRIVYLDEQDLRLDKIGVKLIEWISDNDVRKIKDCRGEIIPLTLDNFEERIIFSHKDSVSFHSYTSYAVDVEDGILFVWGLDIDNDHFEQKITRELGNVVKWIEGETEAGGGFECSLNKESLLKLREWIERTDFEQFEEWRK